MLKTMPVQAKAVICMLCGRPAEQTICACCAARIRGEAVEARREVEKKVQVETSHHATLPKPPRENTD